MSSLDKLATKKPRENAGSRSSNRFEYQINWGLSKLIELERNDEDYVMIFDYHDDIVVCNSDKKSDFIDFYQVKTKKTGWWTKKQLNQPENTSDDDEKEPTYKGIGILSKLVSHTKTFSCCRKLYFVTNASLAKQVYSHSANEVSFDELNDDTKKFIQQSVMKEIGDTDNVSFEKITFIINQMNVNNYENTLIGILSKFLKDKFDLVTDVNAVYETLIAELRKRNNYEDEINTKEELIQHKSITHEEFGKYLAGLTTQKRYEELRNDIIAEIHNVTFYEKNQIIEALNTIYEDLMNYENDELMNLISEIRNVMSQNPITINTISLWQYALEIYDKLMASYVNYKKHSEFYIKSLILYLYVRKQQRIV